MDVPYQEFPIVILDEEGVVDRVATPEEADDYLLSMPNENLRWEKEQDSGGDER